MSKATSTTSTEILLLDFEDVRPDPDQPRKDFDPEILDAMADTFHERGQITPARVRRDEENPTSFIIVDGECRWRVGKKLHDAEQDNPLFAKFKAYVEDVPKEDLVIIQFLSNAKHGHTPAEKVAVLTRLIEAGVPRNMLRTKLGITKGQFRLLKEIVKGPQWLLRYADKQTLDLPMLTEGGQPVVDEDGKPRTIQTNVQALPVTHLAVLSRYANRLIGWDREQQAKNPGGEHTNVARATICRVADRAVRETLSVAKLSKLCEEAKERATRQSDAPPARREPEPPFAYASNGSLRIPTTDPERLPPHALAALVTELEQVIEKLRSGGADHAELPRVASAPRESGRTHACAA
ncbi:ParB/RepB/Spo0J family partition protein [Myxococcota bacterium]